MARVVTLSWLLLLCSGCASNPVHFLLGFRNCSEGERHRSPDACVNYSEYQSRRDEVGM
jgi:hypothetical protein